MYFLNMEFLLWWDGVGGFRFGECSDGIVCRCNVNPTLPKLRTCPQLSNQIVLDYPHSHAQSGLQSLFCE